MRRDIKRDWVAALEGRNYTQGVHMLRDEAERFSALGVLADLLVYGDYLKVDKPVWARQEYETIRGHWVLVWKEFVDGKSAAIHEIILDRIGLSKEDADMIRFHNDIDEYPFKRIAGIIRRKISTKKTVGTY